MRIGFSLDTSLIRANIARYNLGHRTEINAAVFQLPLKLCLVKRLQKGRDTEQIVEGNKKAHSLRANTRRMDPEAIVADSSGTTYRPRFRCFICKR